ncbi:hypothetical protein PpBr36_04856 [Pyricularia pennisetigena]|uniref:hypothetical protein n=1 Tax=Pyricularia pennisetigena TaxID=1578925 RepID=UPI00114EB05B|nr:hypothetical protein PpBr36_04856 [Pyricularia pennisetigena]TLS27468.1 hypothetical protein PpBr36_04856 [Pyricularia pennisetigena]
MFQFMTDRNVMLTSHLSSNMLLAALALGISVFAYGFEGGVVNTTQAMPKFIEMFGERNPATGKSVLTPSQLAYLNSIPLVTYAVGVVVASQLSERFGRKMVFFLMNSICISGVAISYTSTSYGQILAGRMILQTHIGMEAALVPMYMAEIVPSAIRGRMVASYTFSHICANFISSIITNFTSKYPDHSSWRIPFGIIFTFPALALLLSIFLPESPRWLLRKGKPEEARAALWYLNSAQKEFDADEHIKLQRQALEDSVEKGKWSDLLKGTNKKRTITAIVAACSSMLTGMSFASNYGTVFLAQVNIMDPFTATMIKRAVLLLGPITVMTCIERLGRRKTFLSMGTLSATSLLMMGVLGAIQPATDGLKRGIVALSVLFPYAYIASFGSIMQIVPSEISHISLRDKTSMVYWIVSDVANFAATFSLPYLLSEPYAALGAKVAFIYAATSVCFLVWAYFCYHELTGRSLEEVDELFAEGVPAWRSAKWVSTSKMGQLTALENSKGDAGAAMREKATDQDSESTRHVENGVGKKSQP